MVRSLARLVLWRAKACVALRSTVSSSARLSPRCGTRSVTVEPRRPLSQTETASASGIEVRTGARLLERVVDAFGTR